MYMYHRWIAYQKYVLHHSNVVRSIDALLYENHLENYVYVVLYRYVLVCCFFIILNGECVLMGAINIGVTGKASAFTS